MLVIELKLTVPVLNTAFLQIHTSSVLYVGDPVYRLAVQHSFKVSTVEIFAQLGD